VKWETEIGARIFVSRRYSRITFFCERLWEFFAKRANLRANESSDRVEIDLQKKLGPAGDGRAQ
jgi:hypothetical protein